MVESKEPSLGKSFSKVALLTIASKMAGLVRDVVVAAAYGATPLSDAYNTAYLFTGNILVLFGGLGGPFHSATVVILKPKKDDPESGRLIMQILVATGIILLLATLIVFAVAPYLIHWQSPNYGQADPLARAVFYRECINQVRWMSPLIFLSGLIGVTYGVLNVFNKVFWPSMSPSIASLAIVVALLCFPNRESSLPLALGTLVGAFGQLFAQVPDMFRCNLQYKMSFKPAPGLRKYLSILWPAFVGTSIGQLTVYVDSYYSSSCEVGAWTAISNANRLVQLPLGVLITAMVVPILPRFTQQASSNKPEELKVEFRRALKFLWFISMPLTTILFVLPRPIIQALYQRKAWGDDATNLVTIALVYLAPSIILYIGRDLISRVFYAYEDSKTPYYVGVAVLFVKALLNYIFVYQLSMGIAGISLATSLITVFNFTCLSTLLRRKIGPLGLTSLLVPLLIMALASVAAGFAMHFVINFLAPFYASVDKKSNLHLVCLLGAIGTSSFIGLGIYGTITVLCKLEEPLALINRLKRIPAAKES